MDVRLPDGTVISNVPDGMSKADLTAKLAANGYDITGLGGATAPVGIKAEGSISTGEKNVSPREFNEALRGRFGTQLKGAVAGFADIGDTILNANVNAYEGAKNLIPGMSGKSAIKQWNDERTASLDATNQANNGDLDYAGGKIVGNVAATWPVGGVLGTAIKGISAAPAVQALGNAAASGGFKTGLEAAPEGASMLAKLAAQLQNAGTRVAGGALTGGASTALIDPENTATGAMLGGALPVVAQAAGKVTGAIGNKINVEREAEAVRQAQNATRDATVQASRDAGYVIPPTAANPTWLNRTLESIAGKDAVKQAASVKNADVTDRLARESIGLPADTAFSEQALLAARKEAGKAYAEVAALSPKASETLEKLKDARNEATAQFKFYNRSANPEALRNAKSASEQAAQLEQELEKIAEESGKKELIPALRNARVRIAKNYTLDKAMNDATGTIDAKSLARQSNNGAPLTGEQEIIANFANAFPTAVKTPEAIGGDGVSKLKMIASLISGGTGTALGGPLGATAGAIPFVVPDLAKSLLLSKTYQNMAANPKYGVGPTNKLIEALINGANASATDEALYRVAPALLRDQ